MTLHIGCIGVLAHPLRPQSFPVAAQICDSIHRRGIDVWLHTEWKESDVQEDIKRADMVVAIGGDGAMLRAARVCAPLGVAVLGINMGQLGFLTEIADAQNWEPHLEHVLNGNYWIEHRLMLRADVMSNGDILASGIALNDVVISSSTVGRMIELETYIDDDWTTTYYADALVVATATGSTAYTLALGGPILPPELGNILIVPSAPHLSLDRPIVLAEGSNVDVLASNINSGNCVLLVDGTHLFDLEPEYRVRVQASDFKSQFVRVRGRNYFYRSLLERFEPRVRRSNSKERQL